MNASRVLEARSAERFRSDPLGGYVAGERWAFFCLADDLFGYAVFGRPSADDIEGLVRVFESELSRPPHKVVAHLGALQGADTGAFAALAKFVAEKHAVLSEIVTQAAFVRPAGLPGALVGGFFNVVDPPFEAKVFTDVTEALRSVGYVDPAHGAAQLERMIGALSGSEATSASLGAYLSENSVAPDLQDAARSLSISPRTLQRRLTGEGTSFAAQVAAARVRHAVRLLEETELSVSAIGYDVGFSSPQQFSRTFRAELGVSPSAYRDGLSAR